MFNNYLVKSKGKYLNIDDKPKLVDKEKTTRFEDEFSADSVGSMYCKQFEVHPESYDK